MKLSQRLRAIVSYIPPGSMVADIGTDHAYLPVHLVRQGISAQVIAADVHNAPFQSALRTVEGYHLGDHISVRLGDGLKVLRPGEAEVIVVAGMGGRTMEQIFNQSPEILRMVGRLVLQPMTDTERVRKWLWDNEWTLMDEELIDEEGKLYELLVAIPGREEPQDPFIGPKLIEKRHPLLIRFLQQKQRQIEDIVLGMENSNAGTVQTEKVELLQQLEKVKKVKAWLTA